MIRRSIIALVILGAFFAACGSASAGCDDVLVVVGVLVCSDDSLIPPELRPLVALGKDLSAVYSGVTDTIKLLQLVGVLPTEPTPAELFALLDRKLENIATVLVDHDNSIARAQNLAHATTAANLADTASENAQRLSEGDEADFWSLDAVNFAFSPVLFARFYSESATDGGTDWKKVIADRPEHSDGTVYDWRFNVPHLQYAIGLRIKVMTAIHPEWPIDGHWDDQLRQWAKQLSLELNKILNGVKCGVSSEFETSGVLTQFVACADIHTGISAVWNSSPRCDGSSIAENLACSLGFIVADFPPQDRTTCSKQCTTCSEIPFLGEVCSIVESCVNACLKGSTALSDLKEGLYRQVVRQLPIFQLLSQINTLNSYLSHAQTLDVNRIPGLTGVDPGYEVVFGGGGFRVMADVNGDERSDFCRFVGDPRTPFLSCALGAFAQRFGNYDVNSMPGLDTGYPEFRVMADVNNDKRADYCRFVGNPGAEFLSCALATADGRFGNYDVNSLPGFPAGFDRGYPDFRVMVDVNGDGRADYCRFVGDPGVEFLSCALATPDGRFGNYDVTLDVGSKEEIEQRWGNAQLPQN
jgi:hypothetical protein